MRNCLIALGLVLICLLPASFALAQQSAEECAELENDQERLDCFDRFFSRDRDRSETPAASGRDRRGSSFGTSSRSSRTTSRAEPEPEPTPEQRFGREREPLSLGGESMTSVAVGKFDLWRRGLRVRLENGQVWRVTNYGELYFQANNPRVRIEQGMLGAYYMHFEGTSQSLKVVRVE